MKIQKIKKLSSGKYKIVLENNESFVIYEDVLLEENILYKKEIDSELLNKINIKNNYYKVYTKALNYLLTKIRSEKEVSKYLDKQLIEEKDKIKIINKLKENRMINDDNFYIAYISDRIRLSNDGPYKIKNYLLEHNISEEKINEELSKYNVDIYSKLEKLINKKIKTNRDSEYIMKQKLTNHFINLGYSKDMIEDILNKTEINFSDSIKQEYNKQLKKLSKKYNGEELIYKIKNNLYKKGYKLDEINQVVE